MWLVTILILEVIGVILGGACAGPYGAEEGNALMITSTTVGFLLFAAPVVWIGWPRRRYEADDEPGQGRRRRRKRYLKH